MKVNIEIDCTPEEARRFMGLPDVTGLQEEMMEGLRAKVSEATQSMDPEAMMKGWVSSGPMEEFQKMFWANMPGATGKLDKS
ncbi:MAG: DUF6489 family protein [Alphaproteobacteria bacterium]|jgi:hypothetical protein